MASSSLYRKIISVYGMIRNMINQKAAKTDIAPQFSPGSSYTPGTLVIYDNLLYLCTESHSGAWDPAHFERTTLGGAMIDAGASGAEAVLREKFAPVSEYELPDTATQREVRKMLQDILTILKSMTACAMAVFPLGLSGYDTSTRWEDMPPTSVVSDVVRKFSPPADLSGYATKVKVSEVTNSIPIPSGISGTSLIYYSSEYTAQDTAGRAWYFNSIEYGENLYDWHYGVYDPYSDTLKLGHDEDRTEQRPANIAAFRPNETLTHEGYDSWSDVFVAKESSVGLIGFIYGSATLPVVDVRTNNVVYSDTTDALLSTTGGVVNGSIQLRSTDGQVENTLTIDSYGLYSMYGSLNISSAGAPIFIDGPEVYVNNEPLTPKDYVKEDITNGLASVQSVNAVLQALSATNDYLRTSGGTITGSLTLTGSLSTTGSQSLSGPMSQGYSATASGDFSHAEGSNASAKGSYSHAEGASSETYGAGAHSEGFKTIASNEHSHAEGAYSRAMGRAAHASGFRSYATNDFSFVWQGIENIADQAYYQGAALPGVYFSHGPGTFNVSPYGGIDGFWIGENTLRQHVNGLIGTALIGYVPVDGTNGFVTASVTNGLVTASVTNGLVTASVTNGLVTASVTNGLVTASITNGLVTASITNGLVTASITNGFVTASVTNGLAKASSVNALSNKVDQLSADKRYALLIIDLNPLGTAHAATTGTPLPTYYSFELKGTTTNFGLSSGDTMKFYGSSAANESATWSNHDSMRLYVLSKKADDDVRRWKRVRTSEAGGYQFAFSTIAVIIDSDLLNEEHKSDITWLSDKNDELIWSYVRFNEQDYERDQSGNQVWRPIMPVKWYSQLPRWADQNLE